MERDSDEHLPTIVSDSLNRQDQGVGPGRPRVRVTREQLKSLNGDAGFTWSEISRTLGIQRKHCTEDVMNLECELKEKSSPAYLTAS